MSTTNTTSTTIACTTSSAPPTVARSRVVRWALTFAGVACVGLAGAGVVLPGLPTTIFLIIATWCFTKSCPWLENRLVRNRFFAPFLCYLDRSQPMPVKAKVIAIGMMWLFVAFAVIAFAASEQASSGWASAIVVLAAGIGTAVIVRWDAAQAERETAAASETG